MGLLLSDTYSSLGHEHVWQYNWFSKGLSKGQVLTYIIQMFYGKEQHSKNPLLTFSCKGFLKCFFYTISINFIAFICFSPYTNELSFYSISGELNSEMYIFGITVLFNQTPCNILQKVHTVKICKVSFLSLSCTFLN